MKYLKDFLNKANKRHDYKYDYSLVKYTDPRIKVTIICPIHGKFEQTPHNHLNSHGCKLCAKEIAQKKAISNKNNFTKQSNKVHNNKYDYSKVKYINNHTKITIICPIHGEFKQVPITHKKGHGCPKCANKSYTTESFVQKLNKIHGDKYDYSKVKYKNAYSKITIICPKHGEFKQKASHHLSGAGCKLCTHESHAFTKEKFTKMARKVHGDKYDYSEVDYKNRDNLITIICPIHGKFEQTPRNHLRGSSCQKCNHTKNRAHTTESFIAKAKISHGNKYDYSKANYKNSGTKVTIVCQKHGEFEQTPHNHCDNGTACPSCFIDNWYGTTEKFINESKKIHGNKYNYSKVNYKNKYTKVLIICPKHGEFRQTPAIHQHSGCPKCAKEIIISSGHQEIINFIKSISDIKVEINNREIISPYELDIYLPNNFAIEYHGLYWHSHDENESTKERRKHQLKHQLCLNNNIKLFQIFENEWLDPTTNEILKSKIRIALGMGNRIFARKCVIKNLNNNEYSNFMNKYHLQGSKGASVKLGLLYQNEIVSVMSFNKHQKYEWEITRFASKLNLSIAGGASKLFKHFTREHNPQQIMTYADCRYSNGDLYEKLGFKLDGKTQPNYFYIKSNKLFSRQQFQKHKLKNKLDYFNPELTESNNMFNNGYRRIWDAGHFRFIM